MKCKEVINEYGVCQHCWDELLLESYDDFVSSLCPSMVMAGRSSSIHRLLKLPNGVVLPVMLIVGKGMVSMQTLSFIMKNGGELEKPLVEISGHLEADGTVRLMFVQAEPDAIIVSEILMEDDLKKGNLVAKHKYGNNGVSETIKLVSPEVLEF